jgi:hypothetical protein
LSTIPRCFWVSAVYWCLWWNYNCLELKYLWRTLHF